MDLDLCFIFGRWWCLSEWYFHYGVCYAKVWGLLQKLQETPLKDSPGTSFFFLSLFSSLLPGIWEQKQEMQLRNYLISMKKKDKKIIRPWYPQNTVLLGPHQRASVSRFRRKQGRLGMNLRAKHLTKMQNARSSSPALKRWKQISPSD